MTFFRTYLAIRRSTRMGCRRRRIRRDGPSAPALLGCQALVGPDIESGSSDSDFNVLDGLSRYGYEIFEEVGVSNTTVHRVRKGSATYAVKHLTIDDGLISKQVIRELHLMCELEHKNIIGLHEVRQVDDHIVAIMDYGGVSLRRALDEGQPRLGTIRLWMRQILDGVAFMHRKGVVHRDLKPQNVLLDGVNIKIVDFGHSRALIRDERLSPTVSTYGYMAPETLLSWGDYGRTADMWSVGCIMYELATSVPLFDSDSRSRVITQIFGRFGTPHDDLWPGVSELVHFPEDPIEEVGFDDIEILGSAGNALLRGLLSIYPDKRMTAKQALRHEFFRDTV